jgi:hypothetical protein
MTLWADAQARQRLYGRGQWADRQVRTGLGQQETSYELMARHAERGMAGLAETTRVTRAFGTSSHGQRRPAPGLGLRVAQQLHMHSRSERVNARFYQPGR